MTFSELRENLKKLKLKDSEFECNLFSENYINKYQHYKEIALFIEKNNDMWEVYRVERGSSNLEGLFYTENDLYEYIYCFYKQISDHNRWF